MNKLQSKIIRRQANQNVNFLKTKLKNGQSKPEIIKYENFLLKVNNFY